MNNKGFTLIELLAVIAIIIIIMAIAIPGVTSSIKAAEKRAFISSVDKILEASKDYSLTSGDSFKLPFDGEIKFISVADLVTNKTISKTNLDGYVAVYNEGNNKYEYFAYLSSDKYSVDGFPISNLEDNLKIEKNQIDYTNFLNTHKSVIYSLEKDSILNGFAYTIGGTLSEWFYSVVPVEDGIIGVGTFRSNDGDFAGLNKGQKDIFIVRINNNNQIVWLKTLGGTDDDIGCAIEKVSGGVVVSASFESNDGDFTGMQRNWGELFIIKYDFNGNLLWSDVLGGNDYEEFGSMFKYNDQVIIAGTSCSDDNIFTGLIATANCSQFAVSYNSDGTKKYVKVVSDGDGWAIGAGASNNAHYLLGEAWGTLTGDFNGLTFVPPRDEYIAKLNPETGSLIKISQYLPLGYPVDFMMNDILFFDDFFLVAGRTSVYEGKIYPEQKHFVTFKYDYDYNLIDTYTEFNEYRANSSWVNTSKCGDYMCRYLPLYDRNLFQQISSDFSEKSVITLPSNLTDIYTIKYENGTLTLASEYETVSNFITTPPKGQEDAAAFKFQ